MKVLDQVIEHLEKQIETSERLKEPGYTRDWNEQIVVLLSREDAEAITGFLLEYKSLISK